MYDDRCWTKEHTVERTRQKILRCLETAEESVRDWADEMGSQMSAELWEIRRAIREETETDDEANKVFNRTIPSREVTDEFLAAFGHARKKYGMWELIDMFTVTQENVLDCG